METDQEVDQFKMFGVGPPSPGKQSGRLRCWLFAPISQSVQASRGSGKRGKMINDENEMVDLYIPRKWCVLPATEPSLLWPARALGSKAKYWWEHNRDCQEV